MTRATFTKGEKVNQWERNLDNPRAALTKIGAMMVAESRAAFKAQKFGQQRWSARAPINVYGIIADFAAGKKKPPNRRFESRPALRDTGHLLRSIAHKVLSHRVVEVGTVVPYAAVLHSGGTIESKPITKSVQDAVGKWLKKGGKEYARELGWILNKKFTGETLKGEVEARPIVGITKQTKADIRELIGVHVMEVR